MRERRHLIAAVLFIAGLALRLVTLSACGGSENTEGTTEIAFTPTATVPPPPKECGDGVLAANEVCDASAPNGSAACTAGKSCVCCACLGPDEPLGTRTFSIARPGSSFISTGLTCTDVSSDLSQTCRGNWLTGPLVLQAGRPDPTTCIAPLTLAQDVAFGFCQPLGIACFKLSAAGSEGSIDCDGGTPYDVLFEQDSHMMDADSPPVITRGLGSISETGQAGNGDLLVMNRVAVQIQGIFDPQVCLQLNYDDLGSDPRVNIKDVSSGPFALTTRHGEALVLNSLVPSAASCSADGSAFSCGRWTQENSEGALVGPVTALGQLNGVIDTANVLIITDQPH